MTTPVGRLVGRRERRWIHQSIELSNPNRAAHDQSECQLNTKANFSRFIQLRKFVSFDHLLLMMRCEVMKGEMSKEEMPSEHKKQLQKASTHGTWMLAYGNMKMCKRRARWSEWNERLDGNLSQRVVNMPRMVKWVCASSADGMMGTKWRLDYYKLQCIINEIYTSENRTIYAVTSRRWSLHLSAVGAVNLTHEPTRSRLAKMKFVHWGVLSINKFNSPSEDFTQTRFWTIEN